MAMLMLNKVVGKTWANRVVSAPATENQRDVIACVHKQNHYVPAECRETSIFP